MGDLRFYKDSVEHYQGALAIVNERRRAVNAAPLYCTNGYTTEGGAIGYDSVFFLKGAQVFQGLRTFAIGLGGTVHFVEAVPDAGYDFIGWSGDVSGMTNPLTLPDVEFLNVFANFKKTGDPSPPLVTYVPMRNQAVFIDNQNFGVDGSISRLSGLRGGLEELFEHYVNHGLYPTGDPSGKKNVRPFSVTLVRVGFLVTATSLIEHGLVNGEMVTISGAPFPEFDSKYNGTYAITFIDSTHFSFTITTTPTTPFVCDARGDFRWSKAAIIAAADVGFDGDWTQHPLDDPFGYAQSSGQIPNVGNYTQHINEILAVASQLQIPIFDTVPAESDFRQGVANNTCPLSQTEALAAWTAAGWSAAVSTAFRVCTVQDLIGENTQARLINARAKVQCNLSSIVTGTPSAYLRLDTFGGLIFPQVYGQTRPTSGAEGEFAVWSSAGLVVGGVSTSPDYVTFSDVVAVFPDCTQQTVGWRQSDSIVTVSGITWIYFL